MVLEHVGRQGAVEVGGQLDRVVHRVLHHGPRGRARAGHQDRAVKQPWTKKWLNIIKIHSFCLVLEIQRNVPQNFKLNHRQPSANLSKS